MKIAGILLAAGASRRFGPENKLLADFDGTPLVAHAAEALRQLEPDILVGVTGDAQISDWLFGYDVVAPKPSEPGQADSLRAGLIQANALGAKRFLVALGDMPFVTTELLKRVADRCTEEHASAATDGERAMPPACFPIAALPDLMALQGDRGAASLLRGLPRNALAPVDQTQLRDIDTQEELHAVRS